MGDRLGLGWGGYSKKKATSTKTFHTRRPFIVYLRV